MAFGRVLGSQVVSVAMAGDRVAFASFGGQVQVGGFHGIGWGNRWGWEAALALGGEHVFVFRHPFVCRLLLFFHCFFGARMDFVGMKPLFYK